MPDVPRFINPSEIHPPRGYTHVAETGPGRTVYIAGQVAMDGEGNLVGEADMAAQADQVFKNLAAALAAVGASFESVVKFTIFVTDVTQLPAVREVRDRYVNVDAPPASTAVQVSALFRPEYMIEVEAVAWLPG
ncbi:MAG TPA: RidA family protein [Dehalococcoidia bacterium]|nr:RidA family protein [Dehalococcoidia bacterium]